MTPHLQQHLATDSRLTEQKDDRPLPHQDRRPRLTEREKHPQTVQATEEKALQTKGAEFRADLENVITRHVTIGIHPCVKITSLRQDANTAKIVSFDMLRPRRSPEKIYSTERRKIGIKTHRQILQGHVAPNENSGKKWSIAREWFKSVRFMSVVLARSGSVKDHMRRLCTKKDAFAKQHWIWRKPFCKFKDADQATFYSPTEIAAALAHISKSPEEREFVVDSRASMHNAEQKRDLSSQEPETLRRSRNSTTVVKANWEVQTNEEAQVYVHDLGLFVTVQLLEETPAFLSLGKLCEEHGCSYEWVSGHKPRLTKQEKKIKCKTHNFVPLVVPGLSSSSGASSSSTSPPKVKYTFKYISKSSTSAKWRSSTGWLVRGKPPQTRNKK